MSEMEDMMKEYRDLVDEINWMHAELHGAEMEAEKLRKVIVSMNILLDEEAERIRAYYERLRSYSLLIDLLRDDWGIDVSWDGLRKFWYISLTEREVQAREQLKAENDALRELVRGLWGFGFGMDTRANSIGEWFEKVDALHDRIVELGVEI